MPAGLKEENKFGRSELRCFSPFKAQWEKKWDREALLLMNVKKSISLCAPLLNLSTRPGLGEALTS